MIVRITDPKALDQFVAREAVFFPRLHAVAGATSLGFGHRIHVDGQAAEAHVFKEVIGSLSCQGKFDWKNVGERDGLVHGGRVAFDMRRDAGQLPVVHADDHAV
ncbi:hypothetical protein FQZ97_1104450 [compost metagenome]